jgi:SAM-dependent methyltransferase
MSQASYLQHNSEYISDGKYEYEKQCHLNNTLNNVQYNEDSPLGKLLDENSNIKIGVDIGCGTGWVANLMSKTMHSVYAIEPSLAAIKIGKLIYPDNNKIQWRHGFAQEHIKNLSLPEPAIFNCFCVLSHLEDDDVIEICEQINMVSKAGSVLSFSECFGCDYHSHLWHIREKDWWQKRFVNWDIDFFGPSLNSLKDARKAFSAKKKT